MTTANSKSLEEKLACSVEALLLRTRAHGIVRSRGIKTVGQLVEMDARELLASQGCGKKTVAEIVASLKMAGFKMANSDGLFPGSLIESCITEIREFYAETRKPKPQVETFHEKQAKEIKRKQLMVMLMRVNGTPFSAITKEIGCTQTTVRIYFSKFARSLAREAEKRKVPVSDILTERNIPLAAIELMKKDGIRVAM